MNFLKNIRPTIIVGKIKVPFSVMFTGITVGNIYNIEKSPVYGQLDTRDIVLFSTLKGWIYGTFFPIAIVRIGWDIASNNGKLLNHFIPFNTYTKYETSNNTHKFKKIFYKKTNQSNN